LRAVCQPSVRCAANARDATRLAASLGAEDGRRHASVPCGMAGCGERAPGRSGWVPLDLPRARVGVAAARDRKRRKARYALGSGASCGTSHRFASRLEICLPYDAPSGADSAARRAHHGVCITRRAAVKCCALPRLPPPPQPPPRAATPCRRSAGSRPGPPKRPRPPHPPCAPAGGGAACHAVQPCTARARSAPSAHCPSAAFMAEQTSMPTCAAAFS
jgi:hypothetical protein